MLTITEQDLIIKPQTTPIVVSVDQLRKVFPKRGKKGREIIALDGVSLQIKAERITILLGENGAGKSTLVKCLTGAYSYDSGNVSILGYNMQNAKQRSFAQEKIGVVNQDNSRSVPPRMTMEESLRLFAGVHNVDNFDSRFNELLDALTHSDFVNKNNLRNAMFMTLSGGQKQLAIIIRALLADPQILILDEPTKGMDIIHAKILREYLQQWVREPGKNRSIVLTSHIIDDLAIGDEIYLLDHGQIKAYGTPQNLRCSKLKRKNLIISNLREHVDLHNRISQYLMQHSLSEKIQRETIDKIELTQIPPEKIHALVEFLTVAQAEFSIKSAGGSELINHLLTEFDTCGEHVGAKFTFNPNLSSIHAADYQTRWSTILSSLQLWRHTLSIAKARLIFRKRTPLMSVASLLSLFLSIVQFAGFGLFLGGKNYSSETWVSFFIVGLVLQIFTLQIITLPANFMFGDLRTGLIDYISQTRFGLLRYTFGLSLGVAAYNFLWFSIFYSILAIFATPSISTTLAVYAVMIGVWLSSTSISFITSMLTISVKGGNSFIGIIFPFITGLAGVSVPLQAFPNWLRYVALTLPFAYLFDLARYIIIPGWQTILPIGTEILIFTSEVFIITMFSSYLFVKSTERGRKYGYTMLVN